MTLLGDNAVAALRVITGTARTAPQAKIGSVCRPSGRSMPCPRSTRVRQIISTSTLLGTCSLLSSIHSFSITMASVYVGNLPYQATEQALGDFFSQAGQVTNVKIVYDRETGRNKGFGFCDFADQASAENAVNTLNGADFNGRSIRVNFANKN
ncbi:hypothetical protein OSTOST_14688 [Ostertagia ostertagi]